MRTRCIFVALSVVSLSALAHAQPRTYNPVLGTPPEAQGWTNDSTYTAPTSVAGGQLTYGPTSVAGLTSWSYAPALAIDFSTATAFIEAELRLTGTGFGNVSGFRRGGFSLYLQDSTGRYIIADLGDSNISLGNDNNRLSDPVAAFDLSSAFHTVRLEAGPAGARLYVDGMLQLSDSLGTGASALTSTAWGDQTILLSSTQTEIRSVVFVPSPAAALPLTAFAIGARRRRSR
jgi:hypothetical protein